MKKRVWSMLLALVICVGLTVPAFAATVQTKAGAGLTAAEQKIYDALETAVIEVAEGKRENAKITITFEPGELTWTAKELGLSSIDDSNVFQPVDEKGGELVGNACYCLKLNLPFEMFWTNNSWRWVVWEEHTDSSVQVTSIDCWLEAIPAYRGGDDIEVDKDTVNPDKVAQGRAVAENAKAIVQANEGKSDYEKLTAYRDAICSLTSYNFDIYAEWVKDNYMSGDPWQLVYVFDKDPKTNVLCEGYAKAFKYLCDLSEFNGDVTCYLVEGDMDGGGHMWNVVRMGDGNFYLADVTNSDTGMTGEHGGLFLTGASGSGRTYTVSHDGWKLTYVYREDNENQYTDGYLPISSADYSPENDKAPAPSFTDLLSWCEKEAVWAAQEGITNGYGAKDKFAPGVDCSQAQILTFLWRAENKPEAAKSPITVAASYQDAVNWAYEKGMIDDSFNPDVPCTRSQAVSYIWQAKGTPEAAEAASFSDVDAGASYAGAVSWAVEKGITNGYGGNDTFAPNRVCSRGQIVCFLYRAYND